MQSGLKLAERKLGVNGYRVSVGVGERQTSLKSRWELSAKNWWKEGNLEAKAMLAWGWWKIKKMVTSCCDWSDDEVWPWQELLVAAGVLNGWAGHEGDLWKVGNCSKGRLWQDRVAAEVSREAVEVKEWLEALSETGPSFNLPSAFSFYCPRFERLGQKSRDGVSLIGPRGVHCHLLGWSFSKYETATMLGISASVAFYFILPYNFLKH